MYYIVYEIPIQRTFTPYIVGIFHNKENSLLFAKRRHQQNSDVNIRVIEIPDDSIFCSEDSELNNTDPSNFTIGG